MTENTASFLPQDQLWDTRISLIQRGNIYSGWLNCHRVGPAPDMPYQVPFETFYHVSLLAPSNIGPDAVLVADESPWQALLGLRILLEEDDCRLMIAASRPDVYPLLLRKFRESTSLFSLQTGQALPEVSFVTAADPGVLGTVADQTSAFQQWYRGQAATWEQARQERQARQAAGS